MGYYFVKTKDGSVGLFDEDVNDIYHSSTGAYQEAFDKFVIPAQLERFKNKACKVLDICYGIGYNTKALLKYNIENNLNINFKIDAVEINRNLIEISPFIKMPKNEKLDYEIDKFILNSYLRDYKINLDNINELINKNKTHLSKYKPDFAKILSKWGYKYNLIEQINSNLHNIYYHTISSRHKKGHFSYKIDNSSLKWHVGDARGVILDLDEEYDIIFLDAFTATKQPILWTLEFISLLSKKLDKSSGLILSYSKAAPYRKALLLNGLKIGKFYNNNNIQTTLATFNNVLLKYNLDSFELGLLDTKGGIPYEDKFLSLSSDEILKNRQEAVKLSKLETSSSYYKRHNRRYGKY